MENNVQYDPSVIHNQANQLYRSAKLAEAVIPFITSIICASFFCVLAGTGRGSDSRIVPYGALGLLIGFFMGYAIGKRVAFSMRLRAQLALCQVHIEYNTRS